MKPLYKGLAVALLHVLIVLSLGGKLLYDRATRPRGWVRVGSMDPNLPIRGRYFTLNIQAMGKGFKPGEQGSLHFVKLSVEDGQLVVRESDRPTGVTISYWAWQAPHNQYVLSPPVLFFLPEHADISQTMHGELWAEVTVPKKGPPRPIQLAVKRGNEWMPLTYK